MVQLIHHPPPSQLSNRFVLTLLCVHDPFLTPFSDKVLDQVMGREAYSFTDGFYGYHQVRIEEVDKKKTTFKKEWGSFCLQRHAICSQECPNSVLSDRDFLIP
jgi:hypothetical protein